MTGDVAAQATYRKLAHLLTDRLLRGQRCVTEQREREIESGKSGDSVPPFRHSIVWLAEGLVEYLSELQIESMLRGMCVCVCVNANANANGNVKVDAECACQLLCFQVCRTLKTAFVATSLKELSKGTL